jgi:hypothetical protein
MWRGKLKRMQETGVIEYIELLEVVYLWDTMTNVNNKYSFSRCMESDNPYKKIIINNKNYYYAKYDGGFIPQEAIRTFLTPKLLIELNEVNLISFNIEGHGMCRIATEVGIRNGVLLVALMPDGRKRNKFVLSKDIEKRRKKSKMPNIWEEWTDEMYKKTAITIFEGEIGKRSLEYSEQYETQDEDEVEEPVTVDQETEYVEEAQEAEEVTEVFQDEILRSQLDQLVESSGVLTPKEVEGLSEVIDTLDDTMLMKWISAINARVEKREKESAVVNKNEPPI